MEWITPSKRTHSRNEEVVLTTIKDTVSVVRFYNDSVSRIGTINKLIAAVHGSRLYFKEDSNGWKLIILNSSKELKTKQPLLVKFCKDHKGGYMLKYDVSKKLYYVDTNEREGE